MRAFKVGDTVISLRGMWVGQVGCVTEDIYKGWVRVKFPMGLRSVMKGLGNIRHYDEDMEVDEGL